MAFRKPKELAVEMHLHTYHPRKSLIITMIPPIIWIKLKLMYWAKDPVHLSTI
jgi:hypothetical protein